MPPLSPATPLRGGRLRLLSPLRTGSIGEIWRALDVPAGQVRAVKAIALDRGGAAAVAHESEATLRVKHPNVIGVSATFIEADHGFIVMELAACSLADLVEHSGPLALDVALWLALEVGAALGAAHAAGVVHRDVKPHNILISGDGSVKVADFGIARLLADGAGLTRSGAVMGTIAFMAPEQRRDPRDVRPATDVYALMATLVWSITDDTPGELFMAEVAARLAAHHPALPALMTEAAAYDPLDRVPSTAALADLAAELGLPVAEAEHAAATLIRGLPPERPSVADAPVVAPHSPLPPTYPTAPAADRWPRGRSGAVALAATIAGAIGLAVGRSSAPRPPTTAAEGWAALPRCADAARSFAGRTERGPLETVDGRIVDLDQDGSLDVIFSNQLSHSLSIWWGAPGALPSERVEIPTGRHDRTPAVIDLNGDGRLDLVVPYTTGSGIGTILATGPRAYALPEQQFQSPPPVAIAAADRDGDGQVELAFFDPQRTQLQLRWGEPSGFARHRAVVTLPPGASWIDADPSRLALWAQSGAELLRYEITGPTTPPKRRSYPVPGPVRGLLPLGGETGAVGLWVPTLEEEGLARLDATTGAICWLGALPRGGNPMAAGDLDRDGVIDVISAHTCGECTSDHTFFRGER